MELGGRARNWIAYGFRQAIIGHLVSRVSGSWPISHADKQKSGLCCRAAARWALMSGERYRLCLDLWTRLTRTAATWLCRLSRVSRSGPSTGLGWWGPATQPTRVGV